VNRLWTDFSREKYEAWNLYDVNKSNYLEINRDFNVKLGYRDPFCAFWNDFNITSVFKRKFNSFKFYHLF
jgi:hypothetical protein